MKTKQIWISTIVFALLILLPTLLWMRDYHFSVFSKIDGPVLNNYFSALSVIVSFSPLLIGFVLLNVAIKAAKNFDVKKQFHNKQFEQVCGLAQEILDTKIKVAIYQKSEANVNYGYNKTGYAITFYSLGDFIKSRIIESAYLESRIDDILPFLRYRYNPLIPKIISSALFKLEKEAFNSPVHLEPSDEILENIDFASYFGRRPDNYIVIGTYSPEAQIVENSWTSPYFNNISDLRENADNIRSVLLAWFKVYGADDINI
ncbi:MAG: hypothetical protein V4577_28465 [Bacteroidota bacterium]